MLAGEDNRDAKDLYVASGGSIRIACENLEEEGEDMVDDYPSLSRLVLKQHKPHRLLGTYQLSPISHRLQFSRVLFQAREYDRFISPSSISVLDHTLYIISIQDADQGEDTYRQG